MVFCSNSTSRFLFLSSESRFISSPTISIRCCFRCSASVLARAARRLSSNRRRNNSSFCEWKTEEEGEGITGMVQLQEKQQTMREEALRLLDTYARMDAKKKENAREMHQWHRSKQQQKEKAKLRLKQKRYRKTKFLFRMCRAASSIAFSVISFHCCLLANPNFLSSELSDSLSPSSHCLLVDSS